MIWIVLGWTPIALAYLTLVWFAFTARDKDLRGFLKIGLSVITGFALLVICIMAISYGTQQVSP